MAAIIIVILVSFNYPHQIVYKTVEVDVVYLISETFIIKFIWFSLFYIWFSPQIFYASRPHQVILSGANCLNVYLPKTSKVFRMLQIANI